MAVQKILVTIPADEAWKNALEQACPDAAFRYADEDRVGQEDVKDSEIILGNVPPKLLTGAPRLRWLQLSSAGAEAYTREGLLRPGVRLTNATGAYGLAISEHMLAGTLTLLKRLNRYAVNQLARLWRDEGTVGSVAGSRTLVVGLGDIGGEYAQRMKALGSYTVGIRKHPGRKPAWLDELFSMDALENELPKADFVALALPGTPETVHLMDWAKLCRMKPNAILLNVGRGTAVVTEDLCRALEEEVIFGAFLDVTDPEPLPPEHPLWSANNVLITPHISGQYHLRQTQEKIRSLVLENLGRYERGEELLNPVDFQLGYRRPAGV